MRDANPDAIATAFDTVRRDLLADRLPDGHWEGRLSSSALSTATAVSAFCLASSDADTDRIAEGINWLAADQNADGGWGDTPDSPSNLPTTMLVSAAMRLANASEQHRDTFSRGEGYIERVAGATPDERVATLRELYGKDRTFAVPILINSALAGQAAWRDIPPLPFELACVPHRVMKALRVHVVSYALPALIAIGQLLNEKRGTRNPVAWVARRLATRPALAKLERIQPESGGFLEAIPLTSFVVMSLSAMGGRAPAVIERGLRFLRDSARPDGSWPIDTDLSMWVTTSAVTALAETGASDDLTGDTLKWIVRWQWRREHPYTQAAPGGWAWTDRSGGVPDVDDTAGALVALAKTQADWPDDLKDDANNAVRDGVSWLLSLQNANGGWPTFCRGWNRLPFDRSASDVTAHALRALTLWDGIGGQARARRKAIRRGLDFLEREQRPDGSWAPLWFGNQHVDGQENPVLGTARVLRALADLDADDCPFAERGIAFLLRHQNDDGGWGGGEGAASSIEETALAVSALNEWRDVADASGASAGCAWLAERIGEGAHRQPAPIGLYFASLWYSERLYPLVWSVSALGKWLPGARKTGA